MSHQDAAKGSRKAFLAAATLSGLAGPGTAIAVIRGGTRVVESVVAGRVDALESGRVVLRTPTKRVCVEVSQDTVIRTPTRGTLGDLRVGERIAAEGEWKGEKFTASAVLRIFDVRQGVVRGKNGNTILTESGDVVLTTATVVTDGHALRSLSGGEIEIGSVLRAEGWFDLSGRFVAGVVF